LGVARRDRTKKEGWRELPAATRDARDMHALAKEIGFDARLMIDEEATSAALRSHLMDSADALTAGDTLLITFSGHGDSVWNGATSRKWPDELPGCDNPPIEDDHFDEAICLYDDDFLDNDFYTSWCAFQSGVRIVLIADCCYAGTISELRFDASDRGLLSRLPISASLAPRRRSMERHNIPPIVLLMAASRDDTRTRDGSVNGAFTGGLLRAWVARPESDTYIDFFDRVSAEARTSHPSIHTNYRIIGRDIEAMDRFEREAPFSLNPSPDRSIPHSEGSRSAPAPLSPEPHSTMTHTNLTITVAIGTSGGNTTPISNAPIVLFNHTMTINRVGFTHADGVYVFVDVPDGEYILMVMEPVARRFQILAQSVAGTDPETTVVFANNEEDRGRIVATVLVGAVPAVGRTVNVYTPGGTTPVLSKLTDSNGKAYFPGLTGTYDVAGVGNGSACTVRIPDVFVPEGDVDVPVVLPLPASC
jgi:hypothetical protein